MSDLLVKLAAAEQNSHSTLRFSECDLSGRKGYRWGSVQTDSIEVVQALCALWNARHEIAVKMAGPP